MENEDGPLLLRLLDVQHWRDIASHYDQDPSSKTVSEEDKIRMMMLAAGDPLALVRPTNELSKEHINPQLAFGVSPAKKASIKTRAQKFSNQIPKSKR